MDAIDITVSSVVDVELSLQEKCYEWELFPGLESDGSVLQERELKGKQRQ